MTSRTLRITLLASEWKSSKGGLSTMNRELAIHLAKHPNVSVNFFLPKCCDEDKKEAGSRNVKIVEAEELPGFEPVVWLAFPPKDLPIDFVIGHGVILGKQAQIIRGSHHCNWMQVVHTAPEELAMYKKNSDPIPKGGKKQRDELKLCQIADLVVGVGPKLHEFYSAYLTSSGKDVYNFTPGIFTELSSLNPSTGKGKKFRILVFGRGDSEDFELKGFDIAARAVAKLKDRSYHLTFVGAPSGRETQVTNDLLKEGLERSQLIVKGFLENREELNSLLCASNLAIVPSRTEGFGLTALEALSVGLPFLVSQNSGFGEAIQEMPGGRSFIVDSEDPEHWAEAIKAVRQEGSEAALQECRELRARYAEKYSWETQCNDLVEMMQNVVYDQPSSDPLEPCAVLKIDKENSASVSRIETTTPYNQQGARPKEESSSRKEPASSRNRGNNSEANELESTGTGLSENRGQVLNAKPAMEAIEDKPVIASSKSKPHRIAIEKVVKDLSVVGWEVKPEPLSAVTHLVQRHRDILSPATDPDVVNGTAHQMISYLENNPLKNCVLVIDGEKVEFAQRDHQQQVDYLRLLQTAEINVEGKIIVIVCCPLSLSTEDEKAVNQTIENAFNDSKKFYLAWFKIGKPALGEDEFIMRLSAAIAGSGSYYQPHQSNSAQWPQIPLSGTGQPYAQRNAASGSLQQFDNRSSFASSSQLAPPGPQGITENQSSHLPTVSTETPLSHPPTDSTENPPFQFPTDSYNYKVVLPPGKTVMLLTRLRNGIISYRKEDVQYQKPSFVVPHYVATNLLHNHSNTTDTELVFLMNESHQLVYQVGKKKDKRWRQLIVLHLHETIMLQTRLINGRVSFEDKDVVVRYFNWQVPDDVVANLTGTFQLIADAELFVISDSQANLKCIVQVGATRYTCSFMSLNRKGGQKTCYSPVTQWDVNRM